MVLNDWADRRRDAETRADRPLPSGRISAGAALSVALIGLFGGPLLAATISPLAGLWVAGIAVLAAVYDLVGRGPWTGPLLLGLCRAANLSIGLVALGVIARFQVLAWCAPLLYGLYVFTLSRLGRHEDGEAGPSSATAPVRALHGLALWLLLVPFIPVTDAGWIGRGLAGLLALAAAFGLWRIALTTATWGPPQVVAAMGCALRRMLVFSACLTLLTGTAWAFGVAALILFLYPVAWLLRGTFPPS
jgi:4-hydroxybenzoate polyprenyltransferase